jgi:hypothetical protein
MSVMGVSVLGTAVPSTTVTAGGGTEMAGSGSPANALQASVARKRREMKNNNGCWRNMQSLLTINFLDKSRLGQFLSLSFRLTVV